MLQRHLKIVLVGPISPFMGGISAFNTSLANTLTRAGHDVDSIAWYDADFGLTHSEQIDISMPIQLNAQYLIKWYSPWSWYRAAVCSASSSPDLLIAHWTLPEVAPIYAVINSTVLRRNPDTKIVYIVHNANPHESRVGGRFMRQLGFRNVSYFMVHANSEKKNLSKDIPCNQICTGFHPVYDRYLKVNNSAKQCRANPQLAVWLNDNANLPILLFFGFVKPYKGLELLLQALTVFVEARLIVAGKVSSACEYLRGQANILGLSNRVYWLDRYIPEDKVSEIFALADVIALPYRSGTQSGVASLALAFNVPVVATDVGGLSESIDNASTGYVVPPGNSRAFAEALRLAYRNRNKLRNGISKFKEARSWPRYCEILLSCVQPITE